jgi:hypothetical protein
MAFSTSIDVAHETVLIRFHGTVTVQDFSQGRLPTDALRSMAKAPPSGPTCRS